MFHFVHSKDDVVEMFFFCDNIVQIFLFAYVFVSALLLFWGQFHKGS